MTVGRPPSRTVRDAGRRYEHQHRRLHPYRRESQWREGEKCNLLALGEWTLRKEGERGGDGMVRGRLDA